MPVNRTILHIDMDAFFASIEQRDNGAYRGKPVIVGAAPGNRGVVSAASYEARTFGIHSAMPINEAFRRCPQGIFVRPRMDTYEEASGEIMEILGSFSPLVEQISVDEAFLDITGTKKLWGDAAAAARRISKTITDKTSLTASIGIAPNKFLAKVASDMNKPRGITIVPFDSDAIISWLAPLPIGKIWGVGKKTEEFLNRYGVATIGDAQRYDRDALIELIGKMGADLHDLCRGIDSREVGGGGAEKSISREQTFGADTSDQTVLKKSLLSLSHDVAARSRRAGIKGDTIVLAWRLPDFSRHSRRTKLAQATSSGKEIFDTAWRLFTAYPLTEKSIRLIGVGLTGLSSDYQTNLFDTSPIGPRHELTERAADTIREKFGDKTIFFGGEKAT